MGAIESRGLEHPTAAPHRADGVGAEHSTQCHEQRVAPSLVHSGEAGPTGDLEPTHHPAATVEKHLQDREFVGSEAGDLG